MYRFIEYNHNDSNGTIHDMNNKVQMMKMNRGQLDENNKIMNISLLQLGN